MKRPNKHDFTAGANQMNLDEKYQDYYRALEAYTNHLEAQRQDFFEFLQRYMQLRKRQQEYFKKRSKSALIFCKENEPKLDQQARELYQQLSQPKLIDEES